MLALLTVTTLALQQSIVDSSPFRALALPPATPMRSAAGALVACIPPILVYIVLQKQFISGLTLGSTKG